jgi:hypothetical protein
VRERSLVRPFFSGQEYEFLCLDKRYIFKEAAVKFLKENEYNLLDVISQAFRTQEVVRFLKDLSKDISIYQNEFEKEQIAIGKGVQGIYKKNVLKYYDKKMFDQKESWINHDFIAGKLT